VVVVVVEVILRHVVFGADGEVGVVLLVWCGALWGTFQVDFFLTFRQIIDSHNLDKAHHQEITLCHTLGKIALQDLMMNIYHH
jgi:hypothetical protein